MSSVDGSNGTGGGGAPGPGGGGGGTSGITPSGVAAKITHVKTTTIDAVAAVNAGGIALSGLTAVGAGAAGTIMTSGGVSAVGAIKVGAGTAGATSISGAPITLNTSQSTTATTSIRAIGAGGQSTQVRVVMGNLMPSSMIKQLETATPGRAQITAFPTTPARSVPNTSITVTRPATQTTYLPRAGVTATQMTGVGVGVPAAQRLVTPIRTTPAAVTAGGTGATVTGLSAGGNFVRGATVSRNSTSPATTVISPATTTTWMAANPTGQVQLIRAIPHQPRQRIINTQSMSGVASAVSGTVAAVSGTIVATTTSVVQSGANAVNAVQQTPSSQQTQGVQSTIQAVSSAPHSQQQQTYVATLATVLPPRQHQATLVYSSNVATSQPLSQPQQFNHTTLAGTGPRFAVATPLSAGSGTGTTARQIRPIPLGKSFSAAKLNTTSISIRAPNLPQLTPTLASGVSGTAVTNVVSNSPRTTTATGVTGSGGNVISSTNLSATRIIQLQQQPGGAAQQIIGSTGRLAGNVMLQPIIVNTTGGGKIGIRPPVSMAAKVQPSLTITQLGIGKLPASATTGTIGQHNVTNNMQNIGSSGTGSPSVSTASVTATNLSTNTPAQLVSVSQVGTSSGQLLTTQNIVSSVAGGGSVAAAVTGATVVPLAISARGAGGGNIITGTMTPLKNANAITVGKVMTQAQLSSSLEGGGVAGVTGATGTASTANVFIHHTSASQRPHSGSSSNVGGGGVNTSSAVSVVTTAGSSVFTSAGNAATNAFLQPGSTIYYESVPASSVQVSTGVLSLTTTTVTSSTMSQSQVASSNPSLSISSLPFVTHGGGSNASTATFTVVPSGGGRTIGQLQIPVSSGGSQIQTVPVRFSQLNSGATDAIAVSQTTPQFLPAGTTVGGDPPHIIIPAPHQSGNSHNLSGAINGQQSQHMVIPLQTSIKVAAGSGNSGTTMVSSFLRKRDADGSPIRAAKNLGPTLLSMGTGGIVTASSPASSSVGSSYSLASMTSSGTSAALTVEALAKKDRTSVVGSISGGIGVIGVNSTRSLRADSPASSDGSTTVSANSSPGVDQQMQDGNLAINRMPGGGSVETHFNPINELYSNHHSVTIQHPIPVSSRNSSVDHQHVQASASVTHRLNGGPIDCPPRKKSRRSTNDSQQSTQSQTSLILPPPAANSVSIPVSAATDATLSNNFSNGTLLATGPSHENNGKENAKPVDFVLKRPRNCTLLNTYKQTWKSVNNHFQRYSDVKPREERRPTIIDLANQANVLGKINGWKIYHLRSQMEDLCENESNGYEKLSTMLKQMESHGINAEIERISDLLKGNMQRSKIIVDGVNEAQNQIMKIFEHKSHISDIIHRCASKRNFKKREKV